MHFKSRKLNKFGLIISTVIVLMILIGIFYTPYNPNAMDSSAKFASPSIEHIFGCDQFGRDVFSRVLVGGRTTLLVGGATVLIGAFFGMILGAVTGFKGGAFDEILMRINDVVASFPSILLALIFVALFGPNTLNVILALGIAFIPSFARIVRSEFIKYKNADFVKSAKLMGVKRPRILFVHILPNILPTLLSAGAIGFNNAVLAEAGMSYLGIGVMPPDASLGRMMSESQAYLSVAPWCAVFPGLFIVFMVLGFSLLSESLIRK